MAHRPVGEEGGARDEGDVALAIARSSSTAVSSSPGRSSQTNMPPAGRVQVTPAGMRGFQRRQHGVAPLAVDRADASVWWGTIARATSSIAIWFRGLVCRSLACLISTSFSITGCGATIQPIRRPGTTDLEKVPQ